MADELDPALVWLAIAGIEDELTPQVKAQAVLERQVACPRGCPGPMQREISAHHTFADESYVAPRGLMRCPICQALVNPYLRDRYGMASIVEMGEARLVGPVLK